MCTFVAIKLSDVKARIAGRFFDPLKMADVRCKRMPQGQGADPIVPFRSRKPKKKREI